MKTSLKVIAVLFMLGDVMSSLADVIISDSLTVYDNTGAIVGQVVATEAQETINGPDFLYVIDQDWADPTQQGAPTGEVTEANNTVSDVFGVTNGAVAGCSFANGCLAFGSDTEIAAPNFTGTAVPEGNGVFDATKYLSPALQAQGWKATFRSDPVPEPSSAVLVMSAFSFTFLVFRRRHTAPKSARRVAPVCI